MPAGGTVGDAATDLRVLLRSSSAWADERWRQWARDWMEPGALTAPLLGRLWHEVCAFDEVLAAHVEEPLAVPDGTVIVAGSGKESFKTFNVSTAASILAAAAGIKVVKGVSRSVSAVSGAADVLDALGVVATGRPEHVAELTEQVGIAFVSYAAFCPSYAGRYDGVFRDLSPFSFFMPSSVLAVRASAFVYGLAHPDVELAARAIVQARPELDSGFVVSTTLASGEVMDERAPWGTSVTADMRAGAICCWERTGPRATSEWRRVVGHRCTHRANAVSLLSSLASDGAAGCTELVELNAALIVQAAHPEMSDAAATEAVRYARTSSAARQLLRQLQHDAEAGSLHEPAASF